MNGHFASVDICSLLPSFGLWVADITYVPTWAGFLYLAIVLDGLEPGRDRRSNVSPVSHQAGLARRVTPEMPERRGMPRSSCRRGN
jgi:hypothetical protein